MSGWPPLNRRSILVGTDVKRFEVAGLRTASEAPLLTGPLYAWFVRLLDTRTVHRITLSACSSSDCGTLTPSAFAVLTLIASSNLVGCSTGNSPGLAPFRILST